MTTESVDSPSVDNYRVDLEVFSGPLDLLLHLIRKEEVDIYDIPIARITRQYLRYIEMMKTLDLEIAGEFILMAATLIRIKTRLLLPREEEEHDDLDPREELILALVEYRKYKEAGDILRECALKEERVYVPRSPVSKVKGKVELQPVTSLYDLVVAFQNVLKSSRMVHEHEVDQEEVSVPDRIRVILDAMRQKDGLTFLELFADLPRKLIAVVTFLGLLELARSRRITIRQSKPYADLRAYRGERFYDPIGDIDLIDMVISEKESAHDNG